MLKNICTIMDHKRAIIATAEFLKLAAETTNIIEWRFIYAFLEIFNSVIFI
jgi:hypothetical protein